MMPNDAASFKGQIIFAWRIAVEAGKSFFSALAGDAAIAALMAPIISFALASFGKPLPGIALCLLLGIAFARAKMPKASFSEQAKESLSAALKALASYLAIPWLPTAVLLMALANGHSEPLGGMQLACAPLILFAAAALFLFWLLMALPATLADSWDEFAESAMLAVRRAWRRKTLFAALSAIAIAAFSAACVAGAIPAAAIALFMDSKSYALPAAVFAFLPSLSLFFIAELGSRADERLEKEELAGAFRSAPSPEKAPKLQLERIELARSWKLATQALMNFLARLPLLAALAALQMGLPMLIAQPSALRMLPEGSLRDLCEAAALLAMPPLFVWHSGSVFRALSIPDAGLRNIFEAMAMGWKAYFKLSSTYILYAAIFCLACLAGALPALLFEDFAISAAMAAQAALGAAAGIKLLLAAPACLYEGLGPIDALKRSFSLSSGNALAFMIPLLAGDLAAWLPLLLMGLFALAVIDNPPYSILFSLGSLLGLALLKAEARQFHQALMEDEKSMSNAKATYETETGNER